MLGGVELKEGEGIEVDFADLELSEVDFKAVLPKRDKSDAPSCQSGGYEDALALETDGPVSPDATCHHGWIIDVSGSASPLCGAVVINLSWSFHIELIMRSKLVIQFNSLSDCKNSLCFGLELLF